MGDFLNKLVSIVIVFLMLVLAPLLISYKTDDMMGKREILNDVTQYIDMISDTGKVTQDGLNNLYIKVNSHGLAVDVKIEKKVRVEVPILVDNGAAGMSNDTKTVYYTYDLTDLVEADDTILNTGDVIKVNISEIGISAARRITYTILGIDEGKFEFSLAGTVG